MRKLFIIGCPRSGTTLLQQILNRHPEIVIPPETAFFTKLLPRSLRGQRRQLRAIAADLGVELPPLTARLIGRQAAAGRYEQMAAAYCAQLGRSTGWFGEKTPDHLHHVDRILELFPESRLLLLHRDGRDVAVSLTKVPWSPADPVVNFGIWLDSARAQSELEARGLSSLLIVRYEDLVADPEAVVGRVARFLDLEFSPAMLDSLSAVPDGVPAWELGWKARALEPINRSRIGVWQNALTASQVEAMERWGGGELERLGYDLSRPASAGVGRRPLGATLRHGLWRAGALVRLLLRGEW